MNVYAPRLREAMADYFDHSEVTSRMLRTLGNIGPGGMIIADFYQQRFRATHTRALDHSDHFHLPVLGHGDLVREVNFLEEEYGTWADYVAAVDCTAYECMAERIEDRNATSNAVIRMRQRLQEFGFDMTTAPSYHRRYLNPLDGRGPSVLQVRETYVDRAHPELTLTLKHPLPEGDQRPGLSLIKIADQGRHVRGWPVRVPYPVSANVQGYRLRKWADAYLARTRA
ncbi:hypothetical protein ABZ631_20505 [Nocardiopsis alba]|uniref:hypothetical protein n=1 Tax=Nocardiopsis alba TaxID=53437 RepID=UPI0033E36AFD